MSEFLVNLARRGAGLSPVVKPPASFGSIEALNLDVSKVRHDDQVPFADQRESTRGGEERDKLSRVQPDVVPSLNTTNSRTRQNSESQSFQMSEAPSPNPAVQVEAPRIERGDPKIMPPSREDLPNSMELNNMVQTDEVNEQRAMSLQVDSGQVKPTDRVKPLRLKRTPPSFEVGTASDDSIHPVPSPSQLESRDRVEREVGSSKQAERITDGWSELSPRDPQSSDGKRVRHDPEEEAAPEVQFTVRDWIKPRPSTSPEQQVFNTTSPESTDPSSVRVRIGTVEVRASQPPAAPPPQPTQPIGFSDYLSARLYLPETMD
ncbi:MAG: hypothetical protein GTO18_12360 [Anaerolineales bacterium]|nr:hypothetical protein [Anaerolineales bacterium]